MRRYYFREDSKEPREYLRQSPSSRGNREGRSGNVRDGVSTHNEVAPLAGVSQPLLSRVPESRLLRVMWPLLPQVHHWVRYVRVLGSQGNTPPFSWTRGLSCHLELPREASKTEGRGMR